MSFNSIGADVEVFAKNKVGHHVALCGMVGGTKENPKQLEGYVSGCCVQEDNVSLEFNIPPSSDVDLFRAYILGMLNASDNIIKENGFELSKVSSAVFGKDQLVHPNALVFGCEPDYDAWKMRENKKPTARNKGLRTAGGHIHVGTNNNIVDVIRQMDLFLGVPSVFLDNSESSKMRRELYGKAGACRPKPYGVEYRTLSNFWIFDPELIDWVFYSTANSVNYPKLLSGATSREIVRVINKGDEDGARTLAKDFGLPLPAGFSL